MFGEASIELSDLMEDVTLVKAPLSLNKKYYKDVLKTNLKYADLKLEFDEKNDNKFYLNLYTLDKKTKKLTKQG